jgi:translation elongation factor EF-Ts
MKGPTIEEVKALQQETGEGMMACKKILEQRYAQEEKSEMFDEVRKLYYMDKKDSEYDEKLRDILSYLVRKA